MKLRYILEAAALYFFLTIFRLLPVDTASGFGGWLGRTIGPRMGASRKARANIARAFPDKSKAEQDVIIKAMWDNLGRVLAEYPHLSHITRTRVEIVDPQNVIRLMENDSKGAIVWSAHIANWEILMGTLSCQSKLSIAGVYRAPNNPISDRVLDRLRNPTGKIRFVPKSRSGTRELVTAIKDGFHTGILIDQKYNEGVAVPFFGHDAMTSSAFVQLAQKYDCPLVPIQIERLNGANFRITLFEPMDITNREAVDVMNEAHRLLEGWITERPEQWLWLHRRWPS